MFELAATTYGLTAGRFWSLVAAFIGIAGVVLGGMALARRRRFGQRSSIVALAAGVVGMGVGGAVVAAAKGGPGTGYGIVGGYVALVVGFVAVTLGGLALARSRRARV
jgi:uncharacterized protein DUF6223